MTLDMTVWLSSTSLFMPCTMLTQHFDEVSVQYKLIMYQIIYSA